MNILHTEGSDNWGGQEMRILKEAEGMRARGHEIILAVARGGKLVGEARHKNFVVYELNFNKWAAATTVPALIQIMRRHAIEVVNTHSSSDAWLGGIAARLCGRKVLRTRHLSTPIRQGINSRLLYKTLADSVVTTSSVAAQAIREQAHILHCRCVPTGVDPFTVDPKEVEAFRLKLGVSPGQILVGTACIVRSWKGIKELMQAADLLKHDDRFRWVVVGGGYIDQYQGFIDLEGILTFTGHLSPPYPAIAAMDVFTLLSTAHEGISQAVLQAAYLSRPLITTNIGGLPEVCIDGKTGLIVEPKAPDQVVKAVLRLADDPALCNQLGSAARKLVEEKFLMSQTLDSMEEVLASKCFRGSHTVLH